MLHDPWDLVPDAPMDKTKDGGLHANLDGCDDTLRLRGTVRTTLRRELTGDVMNYLCETKQCTALVGIRSYYQASGCMDEYWEARQQLEGTSSLGHTYGLVECSRHLEDLNSWPGTNGVLLEGFYMGLRRSYEEVITETWALLRTKTWQDALLNEEPGAHRLAWVSSQLAAANITAGPQDLGLLVGRRHVNPRSSVDEVLLDLLGHGHGGMAWCIAPLNLLLRMTSDDHMDVTTAGVGVIYAGEDRQVVALPEGLEPETLELVCGTLDLDGHGELSLLPAALEAARLLQTQASTKR